MSIVVSNLLKIVSCIICFAVVHGTIITYYSSRNHSLPLFTARHVVATATYEMTTGTAHLVVATATYKIAYNSRNHTCSLYEIHLSI